MPVRKVLPSLLLGISIAVALNGLTEQSRSVDAADFVAFDAGGSHTCAVTSANSLQCWGDNFEGQLGTGGEDSLVPVSVLGLSSVTSVATGFVHTCAVLADGTVKCWGANYHGAVGDGTNVDQVFQPSTVCASGSGAQCVPLGGVAAVATGFHHSCALTTEGAVKCWGLNTDGQLGDGTTIDNRNPVAVSGLSSDVVSIAAGGNHACGLTVDGGVKCWGKNNFGQLGAGMWLSRSSTPADVSGMASGVTAIAAGESSTCALKAGEAWCWGDNSGGQLGDSSLDATAVPTSVCSSGSGLTCVPLTSVTSLALGDAHACAVLSTRALTCWGWDGFGQLGDGAASLFEIRYQPALVDGLSAAAGQPLVANAVGGSAHTCVLTTQAALKCWGWNSFGQLGDGTTIDRASAANNDFDRDGCVDERELGNDEFQGGKRNPKYFWDFFDTPDENNIRDGVVTQDDVDRIAARFGANDSNGTAPINRYTDPLSPPPPAPAYHPAFDRGPVIGDDPWDRAPADGAISIGNDILGASNQNGHSCQ